jgi:hypothetical protein
MMFDVVVSPVDQARNLHRILPDEQGGSHSQSFM